MSAAVLGMRQGFSTVVYRRCSSCILRLLLRLKTGEHFGPQVVMGGTRVMVRLVGSRGICGRLFCTVTV